MLEIRLAGLVTIRGPDGRARHLSTNQARVVLARLVLGRDGGTTRDELADAVWPDRLPSTWASALRSLVSQVRGVLAAVLPSAREPLIAKSGRYVLRLPGTVLVDIERAEAAVVAAQEALAAGAYRRAQELALNGVACFRLPLLPEHDGGWVTDVRERVADLLVSGLEIASRSAVALGDNAAALAAANEAVQRARLRESAYRCAMTAHVAAGNRVEALRVYQRVRRTLLEEVGVNPAPETEAAYLELLGPPLPLPTRRREPLGAAGSTTWPPFVGRDVELAALLAAWRGTTAGSRRVVLITGEAGVGKTRLAMEAGARASAEGALVLFGRSDREPGIPYQPFVEALDGYVAVTPEEQLPGLSSANRVALGSILPSMAAARRELAPSHRYRLFDAVTKLVVTATRDHPVFLVMDDLQWADRDTLILLRHLLRQSLGARLLILAIERDDVTAPHPLTDINRAIDCDGRLERLRLRGLDPASVTALIRKLAPAASYDLDQLARSLLSDTAGNPLMLLELLRLPTDGDSEPWAKQVVTSVPRGIHDLVNEKLAQLGRPSRDLLRAAAIAGHSFELGHVSLSVGLHPATALDALDSILETGLIVEANRNPDNHDARGLLTHRYRFAHGIVRRALDRSLSSQRRHYLQARISSTFEPRPNECLLGQWAESRLKDLSAGP